MLQSDEFDVSVDRIERVLSMVKARRNTQAQAAQNPWAMKPSLADKSVDSVYSDAEEPRSGFPTPTKDVSPVIIQPILPMQTTAQEREREERGRMPSVFDRLSKKARIMHHSLASSTSSLHTIRPSRRQHYGSDRTDLLALLRQAERRVAGRKKEEALSLHESSTAAHDTAIPTQGEKRPVYTTRTMNDIAALLSRPYLSKKRRKLMIQRLGKERLAINYHRYNVLKKGFAALLMQTVCDNATTSDGGDMNQQEAAVEDDVVIMNDETSPTEPGMNGDNGDNTNEVILYHPPHGSETAQHSTLMHNHWEYIVSENSYYYNHETGESQWTAPTGFQTQSPWIRHYDANGHEYFVHSISGQSEWIIPPELEN